MSSNDPNVDMVYSGQKIDWNGDKYKATSGVPGYQRPRHECTSSKGPIPEGLYVLRLWGVREAEVESWSMCRLKPSWRIETIPRGEAARKNNFSCEDYWEQWGHHRVRIEPANQTTKAKCRGKRRGFYLHDSTKGYSKGCIEVETEFFDKLIKRIGQGKLYLKVDYREGFKTDGGTKED